MTRVLWSNSSSFDSKGKNPSGSYRPGVVEAISSFKQRPPMPQYASIQRHRASYAKVQFSIDLPYRFNFLGY